MCACTYVPWLRENVSWLMAVSLLKTPRKSVIEREKEKGAMSHVTFSLSHCTYVYAHVHLYIHVYIQKESRQRWFLGVFKFLSALLSVESRSSLNEAMSHGTFPVSHGAYVHTHTRIYIWTYKHGRNSVEFLVFVHTLVCALECRRSLVTNKLHVSFFIILLQLGQVFRHETTKVL